MVFNMTSDLCLVPEARSIWDGLDLLVLWFVSVPVWTSVCVKAGQRVFFELFF